VNEAFKEKLLQPGASSSTHEGNMPEDNIGVVGESARSEMSSCNSYTGGLPEVSADDAAGSIDPFSGEEGEARSEENAGPAERNVRAEGGGHEQPTNVAPDHRWQKESDDEPNRQPTPKSSNRGDGGLTGQVVASAASGATLNETESHARRSTEEATNDGQDPQLAARRDGGNTNHLPSATSPLGAGKISRDKENTKTAAEELVSYLAATTGRAVSPSLGKKLLAQIVHAASSSWSGQEPSSSQPGTPAPFQKQLIVEQGNIGPHNWHPVPAAPHLQHHSPSFQQNHHHQLQVAGPAPFPQHHQVQQQGHPHNWQHPHNEPHHSTQFSNHHHQPLHFQQGSNGPQQDGQNHLSPFPNHQHQPSFVPPGLPATHQENRQNHPPPQYPHDQHLLQVPRTFDELGSNHHYNASQLHAASPYASHAAPPPSQRNSPTANQNTQNAGQRCHKMFFSEKFVCFLFSLGVFHNSLDFVI
jgi:hypothetical protein